MIQSLFLLLSLIFTVNVFAQQWQVTGAVIDIQGFVSADNSCFIPDGCLFPTPTSDLANANAYVIGGLDSDYGVSRGRRVSEDEGPGPCCGTQNTWARSRCFAYSTINGDNTNFITINCGTSVYNQAGIDCDFACIATDSISFTLLLDITGGPNGFPVIVNYSWDHFGGIGGRHDAAFEDSCKTFGSLILDTQGDVLQSQFNYVNALAPGTGWGWNRLQNQGGSLNRVIGDQIMLTGTFRVEANTNVPPPGGNPQTLDDQSATQWGQIRLSLGIPIVPVPPDSLYASWLEFSVDIGGDAEMSDPTPDGNEVFDPGDIYLSSQTPLPLGGADGFINDEIFFGPDPFPVAPDGPPPLTGAPVGSGLQHLLVRDSYFDLDGEDHLDFDISTFGYGPGDPPIGYFQSPCIFDGSNLYVSFDDDIAPLYTFDLFGAVPVNSSSPFTNAIYGTPPGGDEIVGLSIFSFVIPAPVYFKYPFMSESMLHASLSPDPLPYVNDIDDDVDALEIRDGQCTILYFSVDHEAAFGLDPGWIYEKLGGGPGGGYIAVIYDSLHLGVLPSTDIDAFEFAWIPDITGAANTGLALLFSVDDDDPMTPEDESGGLDSKMIYASYLDGTYFDFLDDHLEEDIDAIASWGTPLYTGYQSPVTPPCLPVNDLVISVDSPNETVVLTFSAPQSGIYTIYETQNSNAAAPPSADWTSLVDYTLVAGEVVTHSITYAPLPDYINFAVIATCP